MNEPSKFQAEVLSVLGQADKPMTGAQIHAAVLGCPVEYASSESARVHIHRLRKKGYDIQSERLIGYWLGSQE